METRKHMYFPKSNNNTSNTPNNASNNKNDGSKNITDKNSNISNKSNSPKNPQQNKKPKKTDKQANIRIESYETPRFEINDPEGYTYLGRLYF